MEIERERAEKIWGDREREIERHTKSLKPIFKRLQSPKGINIRDMF